MIVVSDQTVAIALEADFTDAVLQYCTVVAKLTQFLVICCVQSPRYSASKCQQSLLPFLWKYSLYNLSIKILRAHQFYNYYTITCVQSLVGTVSKTWRKYAERSEFKYSFSLFGNFRKDVPNLFVQEPNKCAVIEVTNKIQISRKQKLKKWLYLFFILTFYASGIFDWVTYI